jgi:hypothetical protein
MTGDSAELDVSSDGSRVLVGRKVGEDAKGNASYDLFMHIGSNPDSVAVADTASGVVFDGMTSDGTKVFFTTPDPLAGDTDTSIDLYRADVGASTATVSRVSTGSGGSGNTDACTPPGTPDTWNSASGDGKCNVVALAGGAGVASGDGTVYFLSPEKLDGEGGAQDQANLYAAAPGAAPEFVATIDTSIGKPPPPPPEHPVVNANFGGALSSPKSVAVDQSNGDVYVVTTGDKKVQRFTAAGAPKNFTAGPGAGTNAIPGLEWPFLGAAQVAVDNSGGPTNGDIYVVSQTASFESKVSVYASTGELLTTLNGSGNFSGAFGFACGVTVDNSNGDIYIGDYFGNVWRYSPAANPVTEGDYSGAIATGFGSCKLAAAAGRVYVNFAESEEVLRFEAGAFATGAPPAPTGKLIATGTRDVATDNATGNAYVAQTNKVSVYDDDAEATLLETVGSGSITNSQAVAVRSSNLHIFAGSNNNSVVELGYAVPPYTPIDHPAVIHGVEQSETHRFGDFQITPDGRYAVFASKQQLTPFKNRGFEELYRYDPSATSLVCVSCAPTGAAPASGTTLPEYGLAVSDDGRVFFTTRESFALRDTNEKLDAYEWNDGAIGLISTGIGRDDSGMVTVSSDGVNAYFFTREKLSHQDENGPSIKVYDAREGGGFLFEAQRAPCAAADECRGAGTQAPGPPNINSQTGTEKPGLKPALRCPKGKVKRNGKCVKRRKHRRHRKAHQKRRQSTNGHG